MRQTLMGLMLGSPLNIGYNCKDDIFKANDAPQDPEQHFGMVKGKNLSPKPAY